VRADIAAVFKWLPRVSENILRPSSGVLPGGLATPGLKLLRVRISRLTKRRRIWLLAFAFAFALGATGFFATRVVVHALYWSQHKDEPLEPWMTVGYVAHSYGLAPEILREKLGLAPEERDRRTLAEIAADQGQSFEVVRAALLDTIAAARSSPPLRPPQPQGS
jgi:hypothetical protein